MAGSGGSSETPVQEGIDSVSVDYSEQIPPKHQPTQVVSFPEVGVKEIAY